MATEHSTTGSAHLIDVTGYSLTEIRSTQDPAIVATTDDLVDRVIETAQIGQPQEQMCIHEDVD